MKGILSWWRCLGVIGIWAISINNALSTLSENSVTFWCVSPEERVFETQSPPSHPLHSWNLSLLQGEVKAFQVILRSRREINNVSPEISLPPSSSLKIKWNPVGYQRVREKGKIKGYPDILLPPHPFTLYPYRNLPIWFTVKSEENAIPGRYQMEIRFRDEKSILATIKLKVEIIPYQLLKDLPVIIQGNIWWDHLRKWLKEQGMESKLIPLAKEYLKNMVEHECNAIPLPFPPGTEEKAEFRKFVFKELGIKRFRFPGGMVNSGAGFGEWRGEPILKLPCEPTDIWIRGWHPASQFVPPLNPPVKWVIDWGICLPVGQLPPESLEGSWLEYKVRIKREGKYWLWIQGSHRAEEEIWVDGKRIGVIPKGKKGFSRLNLPFFLSTGEHRIRVVLSQLSPGWGDRIQRLFLTLRPDANPQVMYENRFLNPEFLKSYLNYLRETAKVIKEWGVLERCHLKIWDEPQPESYHLVRELYQYAKNALPEVKTEVTKIPAPELVGPIDIWVFAGGQNPSPKTLQACRARGEETWFYYNSLHGIKQPLYQMRLIGWLLWRFKLQGYHFWSNNYWVEDPWKSPASLGNFWFRGTFLYPDPETGMPLNSVRWEIFRMGMQDYRALVTLEKVMEKVKKERDFSKEKKKWLKKAQQTLEDAQRLFPDFKNIPSSAIPLEEIRERINKLLKEVASFKV